MYPECIVSLRPLCPGFAGSRLRSFVRARVYIISLLTRSTPPPPSLAAGKYDGAHQPFFYMHPGRPPGLPSPASFPQRRTDTPLRYDKVHSRPCWVSCLLCISHDAAPGRCRRPPALRALELLPAIHTALEAAPMLSKELHQPR